MEQLARKLKAMGIHRILVADDTPENINAARMVAEQLWQLEEIRVDFFSSGEEILQEIEHPRSAYNLVLTDLVMEHDKAGLDVLEAAWKNFVPTVIITGGGFSHDMEHVRVAGTVNDARPVGGTKNDAHVWETVLWLIVREAPQGLWGALERRRRFAPQGDGTAKMTRDSVLMRRSQKPETFCDASTPSTMPRSSESTNEQTVSKSVAGSRSPMTQSTGLPCR